MSENDDVQTQVNPEQPRDTTEKSHRFAGWMSFVIFAGVFLPVASLVVELAMRICSSVFFDPIPTAWHMLLLAMVPVSNLACILIYLRGGSSVPKLATFLIGASVGVELIYSVQFIPVLPASIFGIMFFGLGLCGLTPFFALGSSIICGRRLGELQLLDHGQRRRLFWSGMLLACALPVYFLTTAYITTSGLRMAGSPDEESSLRGVKILRVFGSESTMLRACYGLPTGTWADFWGMNRFGNNDARQQARDAFYRVTGKSFNSIPPPKLFGPRSRATSDFEFDSDVGGTAVNSRVTSLNMTASRIDTAVYPDALVAYTEWTLTFANSSPTQREARAEVALPPGGVVSRVTLWVNDEEREAAFSTRGKVREAYQQVAVVYRRDPVLVTSCGPDRVLVQCFPVPPDGGRMKIRLGITTPLSPIGDRSAMLSLPHFIERNFGIPRRVDHSLFIESPEDISFAATNSALSHRIVTNIPDSKLTSGSYILCRRNSAVKQVWSPDRLEPKRFAVVQTLTTSRVKPPDYAAIVIDGSKALKDSREDIALALGQLPPTCRFSVSVAGDEVTELVPAQAASQSAMKTAQEKVRDMKCVGGIDNRPALLAAYDAASRHPNGIVVWIHGPQPLSSDSYAGQIQQRWERSPGAVKIYAVAAANGRNTILADLEKTNAVTVLPLKSRVNDLSTLFVSWRSDEPAPSAVMRERVPISSVKGLASATSHICRLWALDEVMRICGGADSRKIPEASSLAARHQLVTAVSGAVVLETEQQYKDAGLDAVDPSTVPTVSTPEPATWLALLLGLGLVGVMCRRKCRVEAQPGG